MPLFLLLETGAFLVRETTGYAGGGIRKRALALSIKGSELLTCLVAWERIGRITMANVKITNANALWIRWFDG